MGYVSFNLQLAGKPIVVVGGGSVAQRKVGNLLPAQPGIVLVSPTVTFELQQWRESGAIRHLPRRFEPDDLAGAFLAIAATNDREVNRQVAEEANRRGILVEVTDNPALGNVTSPALIRQGDLAIAISTNNKSPALSAAIKRELAPLFGPEYARSLDLLGAVREKLLTAGAVNTYNKQVLTDLAEQLPALFAADATDEIDRLLQKHLGADCRLATFQSETGEN